MKKTFIAIATVLTSSVFSVSAFADSPHEVMKAERAAQRAAKLEAIKTRLETMKAINDAERTAQRTAKREAIKARLETMKAERAAQKAAKRKAR